jgi:hypothetical protein
MPIRAFGIFSGTLIPINFLLVIVMMPPAVIYYEEHLKFKACCCCCDKKTKTGDKITDENDPWKLEQGQDAHSKIENWFEKTWNSSVEKARYVIVALSIIWFVLTLIFAP